MDQNVILGLTAFGAVASVAYFLSQLFAPSGDQKLRDRLRGKTAKEADKAGTPSGVVPMLTQIGQAVAKPFMPTTREKLSTARRNLASAGIYAPSAVKALYGFKFIFAILGLMGGYVAAVLTHDFLLSLAAGGLIGIFAPVMWLKNRIKANQRALDLGLADALDLMVVCIEAGLTVDASMQRVGQELALVHPAISRELGIAHMETRVGLSRAESLKNLGTRSCNTSLQSLTAMLIQADRFGTSIAQALRVHADSLRIARTNRAEEIAAKTSVKLSFPLVLFIFPATFIVLVGPTIMNLLNSPLMK
ncbi:MAG TPA: type II secretion system F family protein [Tepidisphaeraceae bacterium]|nr:type II secretion system F family protein [Tepidisphaeraceae bacterium]